MQVKARMARQPSFDLRMLVGGIIVGDQMEVHYRRSVIVEVLEKAQKLLMAMAWLALRNHATGDNVERREQGGGAMKEVIMRIGGKTYADHEIP